jgi:hypothetical protein
VEGHQMSQWRVTLNIYIYNNDNNNNFLLINKDNFRIF